MPSLAAVRLMPVIAVVLAMLIWGTSFAAMKEAVAHYPPYVVVAVRMIIAVVVIGPFLFVTPRPSYRPGDWHRLLLMSLFEPCLYFVLEARALQLTTSSQAGMIAALVPLLTIIGARFLLDERMSRFAFTGVVVSMAGVILLTLAGRPQAGAPNPLLGNILELGAMGCGAGYVLTLKPLTARYHPLQLTFIQFAIGALFFLPSFAVFPLDPATAFAPWPLLNLLYLGSFVTFGAFVLYAYAVARMAAGQATAFVNLLPVVALLFGWLVMREQVAPLQWAAAVLVMLGVVMSQRRPDDAAGSTGSVQRRPVA
jgi:drug/metabolite transporter (DMT)-like permease